MKTVVHLKHSDTKEETVNYISDKKQKNLIKFSIIGFIVLLIGIIAITINHFVYILIYPIEVKILVAPYDAILTINEKEYKTETTTRLKEGEYKIKITRADFKTFEETRVAKKGEEFNIYEYLERTDGTTDWQKDGGINQSRFETIFGLKSKQIQKEYAKNPIWNITPYHNYKGGLEITAESGKEGEKIKIHVYFYSCIESEYEGLKNKANNYLTSNGINLDDYIIDYKWC